MRRITLLCLFVFGCALLSMAQDTGLPFGEEIQAFRRSDSLQQPRSRGILLVGSSSFRLWNDVQQQFPDRRIINRGFGGSSLPDVIRYADEVIFKYRPRQVVIYCGENDLAASDTVSAQTVVDRFKTLFGMIRSELPRASIVFVSLKPSPSRTHLLPKMEAVNKGVRDFLAGQKRTAFVDVYRPMLDAAGKPRTELFGPDMLHMNAEGYALWRSLLAPYLLPIR